MSSSPPRSLETLVWLTLVSAVGILLGKLRVGKISLGITFVFFVGILSAHFGVRVDPEMNSFAQTLGFSTLRLRPRCRGGAVLLPFAQESGCAI